MRRMYMVYGEKLRVYFEKVLELETEIVNLSSVSQTLMAKMNQLNSKMRYIQNSPSKYLKEENELKRKLDLSKSGYKKYNHEIQLYNPATDFKTADFEYSWLIGIAISYIFFLLPFVFSGPFDIVETIDLVKKTFILPVIGTTIWAFASGHKNNESAKFAEYRKKEYNRVLKARDSYAEKSNKLQHELDQLKDVMQIENDEKQKVVFHYQEKLKVLQKQFDELNIIREKASASLQELYYKNYIPPTYQHNPYVLLHVKRFLDEIGYDERSWERGMREADRWYIRYQRMIEVDIRLKQSEKAIDWLRTDVLTKVDEIREDFLDELDLMRDDYEENFNLIACSARFDKLSTRYQTRVALTCLNVADILKHK